MRILRFRKDDGNALIEAVGFVTIVAGLLLSGGLAILESQQKALELVTLARNTMRSVSIQPDLDWYSALQYQQQQGMHFVDREVGYELKCLAFCNTKSKLLLFSLELDGFHAEVFGVVDD